MAKYSRKGWYIRTALHVGRCYREVVQPATGEMVVDQPTEIGMRAIIEARMNWLAVEDAPVEDCPLANERLWTFKERNHHGQFVGSSLKFIAPNVSEVRRLHAEQVEANKRARLAALERSEIRRAIFPSLKARQTRTDPVSNKRRL